MFIMRAMVLDRPGTPLVMRERVLPAAGAGELLIEVKACGVCRTDLHVVDGELTHPKLPIVPGHEVVGRVAAIGAGVSGFSIGERVGVPWLGATCGSCPYCREGAENLCDAPVFTGYTRDGGYASHTVADARYCFPLGEHGEDAEIAPWLCAGLIGWRSYRMAGEGKTEKIRRSASTASAPPPISWHRWQAGRAGACSPSRARVIPRRRILRDRWVRYGQAPPRRRRPSRSMLPSSSRRSAHWCRQPSRR